MPDSTLVKEYFGYWVVTTDPLLTSAKLVAYGTDVEVENLFKTHDFSVGVRTGIDGGIVLISLWAPCGYYVWALLECYISISCGWFHQDRFSFRGFPESVSQSVSDKVTYLAVGWTAKKLSKQLATGPGRKDNQGTLRGHQRNVMRGSNVVCLWQNALEQDWSVTKAWDFTEFQWDLIFFLFSSCSHCAVLDPNTPPTRKKLGALGKKIIACIGLKARSIVCNVRTELWTDSTQPSFQMFRYSDMLSLQVVDLTS